MKRKISQPSKLTSAPVHLNQRAAHRAKPANRPSCSTSCEARVSPISTTRTWQLKHRGCDSPGHRTSQDGAPPQTPSLLGTSPQQVCLASCLGSGQLRNKLLRLLRPPTPNFDAQHDQACSAVVAHQLRARALLPSTCFPQPRQSDQHSPGIHHAWLDQVQVSDHHVRSDSSTSFWTNPRHSTLQSPPSTCQDSCPRARCSVVATRVKWTATPAGTRSQGERKTKSAKDWGGIFGESARRACGQCQPSSRPSLGPDHGHPGCVNSCEDVTVPEVRFDTRGCLMLPAIPAASGLEIFRFTGCWSDSLCQTERATWEDQNRTLRSTPLPLK